MSPTRPVIAFALLRQCAEALQTDLFGGVSLLIRPLISDLAGQVYNSNLLASRMADAYGISFPSTVLEDFLPRLISAGILKTEDTSSGIARAVYCDQGDNVVEIQDEEEFQNIIDDFLSHSEILLKSANLQIPENLLISGFLTHLSTLDFSSIRARPIVSRTTETGIIQGPAIKEKNALSEQLEQGAAIDVLVASYVSKLKAFDPDKLVLLSKVADGALGLELVLDLQAPSSVPRISSTTVVIDTPILLAFLDLSSKQDLDVTRRLISQISAAGGKIAAFQHSIEEAEGILAAIKAARYAGNAYGPTISRLSNSTYRAFFDSMSNRVAFVWHEQHKFELIQETSTHFYKNFTQQDEEDLTHRIQLSAFDRRLTRERDSKSVAETMRRLGGAHVPIGQISTCKFVFVTGNTSLQRNAARFLRDQGFVKPGEFTPIVTDRYIAGLCWLISGGVADKSPSTARLLANCAAALRLRPELAERTKRFLLALDDEKAKHFEALMTNDRASQYLVEATFGNPDVITALNVEDIFDEVQRRAAELVTKEKDEFYRAQVTNLEVAAAESNALALSLQEKVIDLSIDNQAKELQAKHLAEKANTLENESARQREVLDKQEEALLKQATEISSLGTTLLQLNDTATSAREAMERHKTRAIATASRYADRRILQIRILGCILLFGCALLLGFTDKFWIPTLSVDAQKYANVCLVVAQAIFAILGVAIFFDKFFGQRLRSWRTKLYTEKLLELGFDDSQAIP
ncbi:hypothetical protein ACIPF8_20095 [Collimonas sp. NPDC087041]|uniref:hypothetical protein n=1 Tax=Collimonas sp. NPDC087041 TaxID=3363960 RepID=UPI0037FC784A